MCLLPRYLLYTIPVRNHRWLTLGMLKNGILQMHNIGRKLYDLPEGKIRSIFEQ